ncbi:DMT family transporter [Emcibacter nanhaiensis]|uniref:DMT family transporter n=1 Tax=Emcibacter nanhaiensis TaxID=1505037 RepID=A0A501PAH7_9PROT|nr:DMT family transporter [Emcibacter nanhaiensis]TPD57353.1 DMT family transporter [Emcibacter nanhaiensis]
MTVIPPRPTNNLHGILFMIAGGLCMSFNSIFIRNAGLNLGLFEVVMLRSLVIVFIAITLSRHFSFDNFKVKQPKLIAARSVLMCIIVLANFSAIMYLPLVTVTSIQFTRPLFLVVLAAIFLGEAVRLPRTLATIVGFIGVVIILRPGSDIHWAMTFLLVGTLASSFNSIVTKKLTRFDKPSLMMVYSNLTVTAMCTPMALYNWVTPGWLDIFWVLGIGILSTGTQYFIIRAYDKGEATVVAPFDYIKIIFIALIGYFVFAELPDTYTWIGAFIIVGATMFIAWREARLKKKTQAETA